MASFYSRLGGFEPPLLPPEGSALSPELQTQILILRLFQEHKHYFNILFSKSKEDLDTACPEDRQYRCCSQVL